MENQTTSTSTLLEDIFAQIQAGNTYATRRLYKAYKNGGIPFGVQQGLSVETAQKIYSDTIQDVSEKIYNNELDIEHFVDYYRATLIEKCNKEKSRAIYANRKNLQSASGNGYYISSFLFAVNYLNDLKANPALMQQHGITNKDIEVMVVYYSSVHNRLERVSKKYDIDLLEARKLVKRTLDKFKTIKEEEFVKNNTIFCK